MAEEDVANLDVSKKTFNDSDFIFEIMISNPEAGVVQRYHKDEINCLKIERDITAYYSSGSIDILDSSNFLTALANNDGNWFITIQVFQLEAEQDIELPVFSYSYLINRTEINEISDNATRVRIFFIDQLSRIFSSNVAYSTQSHTDITKAITGLLESRGFSSAAEDITQLPELPEINQPIDFITDSTSTLLEELDFLVSQTYSTDKGFLFLFADTREGNGNLKAIWSKEVLSEDLAQVPEEERAARFLIYNSDDASVRTDLGITETIQFSALSPYENNIKTIYPTYIQSFNFQNCRVEVTKANQWAYEQFEELFKVDENILPRTQLPGFIEDPSNLKNNLLKPFYKEAPNYAIGNFYRQSNADEFYKDLRSYFLYKNLTSFKVLGKIWRQPGQKYVIVYSKDSNAAKIVGSWFCTKIVDEFKDGEYYQYLFMTRTGDLIDYSDTKAMFDATIKSKDEEGVK